MKRFGYILAVVVLAAQAWPAAAHSGDETSLARLDQLLAKYPQQQSLYIKRGGIYSHAARWQLAMADFERAQRLGDPLEVSFELGLMRYRQGDYARSQTQFGRYISLHPEHAQAYLYRARAAQEEGASESAIADFQRYFGLVETPQPGDLLAAARLLAAQPDDGPGRALRLLDHGMTRAGLQPQLQRYAIALELQRGQLPAALQRCRELAGVLGESPQWKVEMAQLLVQANRGAEATVMLEQALEQLQGLRVTPARQALREKIERLKLS